MATYFDPLKPQPTEFKTPLHEKLFWAERHSSATSGIAEHNRRWFASEAVRLHAEVKALEETEAFDKRMEEKHAAFMLNK